MISDLFFIVRIFALTVLVVLGLQVKVGQETAEDKFHSWLQSSFIVAHLQDVIDGGVAITKAGYRQADSGIRYLLHKIGRRGDSSKRERINAFGFSLKRHNETDEDLVSEEDEQAPSVRSSSRKISSER